MRTIGKYIRFCTVILAVVLVMFCGVFSPVFASADSGPKPSVRVCFENMPSELCYATLLSKERSTGPHSAWDGNEEHIYNHDLDLEIWHAFTKYQDQDGYYFLQIAWKIDENEGIAWTYYPPSTFKILLYFPNLEKFVVSEVYKHYAFDTYYTVDMNGVKIDAVDYDEDSSTDQRLRVYKSYQWNAEFVGFIARLFITVVLETGIAWVLFKFREKKEFFFLLGVNAFTQILLNLLLNVVSYLFMGMAIVFVLSYLLAELIVVAIESLAYCLFMNKCTKTKRKRLFYVGYAFAANGISFGGGLLVSFFLPWLF